MDALKLSRPAPPHFSGFRCRGDPRELARRWNFALVIVPWPFEYDLGHNDKRNGRFELGHNQQDMSLLLRYLQAVAKETKHPELTSVPLVGWLGQNGSHLCSDLFEHAPERVLAWSDSFPDRLAKYPKAYDTGARLNLNGNVRRAARQRILLKRKRTRCSE